MHKEQQNHRKHHKAKLEVVQKVLKYGLIVHVPSEDQEKEDYDNEDEEVGWEWEILEVIMVRRRVIVSSHVEKRELWMKSFESKDAQRVECIIYRRACWSGRDESKSYIWSVLETTSLL